MVKLPPTDVAGRLTAREVVEIHAALGFARRQAKNPPEWSPHLAEEYMPSIEVAIAVMYRLGIWTEGA